MKKFNLLFALIIGMCLSIPCFAHRNIKLAGTWKRMEKSNLQNAPVLVWLEDNGKDIIVQFLDNLGPVNVSIAVSDSITFQMFVEATEMSTHIISNERNRVEGVLGDY